jgi:tetratricopeptide (TPR) repeat protein
MMRYSLGPILALFAPLAALGAEGPFRDLSFDAALAAARAEQKPLLVHFTADWCSSCKELDLKALSRGEVKRFLAQRFVAIRVDGEKGEGPSLKKKYHIVGYPTLLVLGKEGTEVDRVFGEQDAEPFLATLRGYLHGTGTIDDLARRLAARPDDIALKADLGARLAVRGERDRAVLLLSEVVRADMDNRAGLASKSLLILGKFLFLRGQNDPAMARRYLEALLGAYPKAKEASEASTSLAIAWSRLGDEARALGRLHGQIDRAAHKGNPYNSLAWFYFLEKKELARALEAAREGVAVDPGNDGIWDTYAEFLFRSGDSSGALAAARRALQLKPDDAYYRYQVQRFSAKK